MARSTLLPRAVVRTMPAALLFAAAMPACAEDGASSEGAAPAAPLAAAGDGRQSYTPADLARYAPRNALDLLRNVPGFTLKIDQSDNRGLGQATDNVLVDGQRLSGKSTAGDQLSRLPVSSIARVDIVDGATMSIPGLSGQVANLITRPDAFSGQFKWSPEFRPHYSHAGYTGAEVSVRGTALPGLDYTFALANDANRGAYGGGYRILDGSGSVIENRSGRLWSDYDSPSAAGTIKWTGTKDVEANLSATFRRKYSTYDEAETRVPTTGVTADRDLYGKVRAHSYELAGDLAFPLAGGRLKLIGIDNFRHRDALTDVVFDFADMSPSEGGRYTESSDSGEVIARAEYAWKWGKADWQLSAEGAFNRFDKTALLFDLDPAGALVPVPFPGSDGGVREKRYEAILSYGRPLTGNLTMQLSAGAENSTISQTGANNLSRTFTRPKGTASFAWTPKKGLDISLKIERAVGQLDFNDFLAQAFLDQGNQNGNNAELVPTQSWNAELAFKKDLGRWGSTNLRFFERRFEDYIDVIPLPGGGEGDGNIPRAERHGFEWTTTTNLDPLGFHGAKIDSNLILQTSNVKDPLTGEKRQLSYLTLRHLELNLRHDVPGTDWAWGAGLENNKIARYYRIAEVGHDWEGPVFDVWFVENKNVLGMTVRLEAINFADARHRLYRTVYTGPRDVSPIAFVEDRAQKIGPIFRLKVSGTF